MRKTKWFCWMVNTTNRKDDNVYVFSAKTREEAADLARAKAAQRGGEYLHLVYSAREFKATDPVYYKLLKTACDN